MWVKGGDQFVLNEFAIARNDRLPCRTKLIELIRLTGGNYSQMCSILKLNRNNRVRLRNVMDEDPIIRAEVESANEQWLDFAELQLLDALRSGERWAVERVLDTIGKKRGWAKENKVELTGELDSMISFVLPESPESLENEKSS